MTFRDLQKMVEAVALVIRKAKWVVKLYHDGGHRGSELNTAIEDLENSLEHLKR